MKNEVEMNYFDSNYKFFMVPKIFFLIALGLIFGCSEEDLTKPANTVKIFIESEDTNIKKNCLAEPSETFRMKGKTFSAYSITGEKISGDRMKATVTVEAQIRVEDKNIPRTEFVYRLTKIDSRWKIVDFSHVPNSNYPAYD